MKSGANFLQPDRDLAGLYGAETRVLNQAVRRNIRRFPGDFMFSLTRQEINNLSQIVISSKIKHAPSVFVFTEQGVAMLSSVLNSERAIQMNIAIMRAFVRLKQIISTHKELAHKLNELEKKTEKHDEEIMAIFKVIRQLMTPPEKPVKKIGFNFVFNYSIFKTFFALLKEIFCIPYSFSFASLNAFNDS